eukprot:gene5721-9541_t
MNEPYHLNKHKNHNSTKEFLTFMNPEDELTLSELNLEKNEIDKTPYNILGVKPDSTQEEIRKNYLQKIKQEHPDTNFNKETSAEELNSAYSILNDPVKKASHDVFGNSEKGLMLLEDNFENDEDLRNKFKQIKRKLQKLERENLMLSQSNIVLGLNLKQKTIEEFNTTNSWQTAITKTDILLFKAKGSLQIQQNQLVPHFTNSIGYRKLFPNSNSFFEVDSIFHPNGVLWSASGETKLFERTSAGVRWYGILYPKIIPFNASPYFKRDFGDKTTGTLTVNLGQSYNATLDITKKYENVQMDYHLKGGYNSSIGIQLENQINDEDSFILGADISYNQSTGVQPSAELTVTNYIDNENQIGAGLDISSNGVNFKLVYRRDRHAFSLPITCCEELTWSNVLYSTIIPSIAYFLTSFFIIKPLRNRYQNEIREALIKKTLEKMNESKKEIESIKSEANKKYEDEKKKSGLVILSAEYGILSDRVGDQYSLCIDVTIPLRNFVYDSKLKLESDSKSQLFGFYDPCPSKSKELRIRYKYKDSKEIYIIIDDEEDLELPEQECKKNKIF